MKYKVDRLCSLLFLFMNKLEETKNILKKCNLKNTSSRVTILEFFLIQKRPFNASELSRELSAKHNIDNVTIYRNLKTLTEVGVLKELQLQKGVSSYELNSGKHHHHLVCIKCNYLEGVSVCEFGDLSERVLKKSKQFSRISGHNFEIFGLCNKCSKN